ncbi:hypothetical protein HDU84_002232 [Entophlyctis sp. JEL0112]|nr:hypothetical protein HDU84_002232 [Entophlyctis sp. JEL0112]
MSRVFLPRAPTMLALTIDDYAHFAALSASASASASASESHSFAQEPPLLDPAELSLLNPFATASAPSSTSASAAIAALIPPVGLLPPMPSSAPPKRHLSAISPESRKRTHIGVQPSHELRPSTGTALTRSQSDVVHASYVAPVRGMAVIEAAEIARMDQTVAERIGVRGGGRTAGDAAAGAAVRRSARATVTAAASASLRMAAGGGRGRGRGAHTRGRI